MLVKISIIDNTIICNKPRKYALDQHSQPSCTLGGFAIYLNINADVRGHIQAMLPLWQHKLCFVQLQRASFIQGNITYKM